MFSHGKMARALVDVVQGYRALFREGAFPERRVKTFHGALSERETPPNFGRASANDRPDGVAPHPAFIEPTPRANSDTEVAPHTEPPPTPLLMLTS